MPQWNSRIVGHDRVAPDQLTAHPLNFRTHPQQQRDALAAAIGEIGFIKSVIVNRLTGNIIDGHERVWQALQSEQEFIDVEYVELTEAEERKALATLDPISEMATIDATNLQLLLSDVQTGDESLAGLLTELAEENGITIDEDNWPDVAMPAHRVEIEYSDAERGLLAAFVGDDEFSTKKLGKKLLERIKAIAAGQSTHSPSSRGTARGGTGDNLPSTQAQAPGNPSQPAAASSQPKRNRRTSTNSTTASATPTGTPRGPGGPSHSRSGPR